MGKKVALDTFARVILWCAKYQAFEIEALDTQSGFEFF